MAKYLSDNNKDMWIRHVLVPKVTDDKEDLQALSDFVKSLKTVKRFEILPYHTLGVFKWHDLGVKYELKILCLQLRKKYRELMIYFIQVITRDILKNEENAVNKEELNNLLENVASGAISPKEAADSIKIESFKDLGFAKVDTNRELRQGMSEVIYGKSKTKEQIAGIVGAMLEEKEKTILITRMSREAADYVAQQYNLNYDELSQIGIIGDMPEKNGKGRIVVATGGTSDIPVAEEAARTAEVYGNEVVRLYDVGVAGMHRLMNHIDTIMNARVIIAIAGMEGALASVIGGMADCPVIAVPTSVGYGANFGGLSALLSMLNSCASGVSVVNIDNGFGAGYLASMINHM